VVLAFSQKSIPAQQDIIASGQSLCHQDIGADSIDGIPQNP
jgi:hypothetical protein